MTLNQHQAIAKAKSTLEYAGFRDTICSACYYEQNRERWVVEFTKPACVLYVYDDGEIRYW